MQFNALPTLETERLILRPITIDDAADIFAYAQNPAVSKLLPWYPSKSIDETKNLIKQWVSNYRNNKQAPWGIVDKASNKVIGTIDMRKYPSTPHRADLGYCLSADYWGKGLMAEAVTCLIHYFFTKTPINEVIAFVRVDNMQSERVLEKVGMHKDGHTKRRSIKGAWINLNRWEIKKNR